LALSAGPISFAPLQQNQLQRHRRQVWLGEWRAGRRRCINGAALSSDGSHRFEFDRQDLRAVLQHDGSAVGSIRGEDLRKNRKFFATVDMDRRVTRNRASVSEIRKAAIGMARVTSAW
jgi:hypothetical protein